MNLAYWQTFLKSNPTITAALMGGSIGGTIGGVLSDPGAEGRGVAQGALLGGIAGSLGGKTLHSIAKRAPSPEGSLTLGSIAGGTLGGYLGKRQLSPWVVQHLRQQGYGEKEASVGYLENEATRIANKLAKLEKRAADLKMEQGGDPAVLEKRALKIEDKKSKLEKRAAAIKAELTPATPIEKAAEHVKEAELVSAFDFGMNTYLKQNGIDRASFIKAANAAGAKVDDANLAEETLKWVSSLQDKK